MSWNVIRKATAEDIEKVTQSATRFAKRHNIVVYENDPIGAVCMGVDYAEYGARNSDGGYLRRLWEACIQRATGESHAKGIAYDTIGYSSKKM